MSANGFGNLPSRAILRRFETDIEVFFATSEALRTFIIRLHNSRLPSDYTVLSPSNGTATNFNWLWKFIGGNTEINARA